MKWRIDGPIALGTGAFCIFALLIDGPSLATAATAILGILLIVGFSIRKSIKLQHEPIRSVSIRESLRRSVSVPPKEDRVRRVDVMVGIATLGKFRNHHVLFGFDQPTETYWCFVAGKYWPHVLRRQDFEMTWSELLALIDGAGIRVVRGKHYGAEVIGKYFHPDLMERES